MLDTARSLLFVPGSTPERFTKAQESEADAVIIDLEDAVAPARKEDARAAARAWLARGSNAVVRVNAAATADFAADLLAVGDLAAAIMVAKCESPDDVAAVRELADRPVPVVPLVESAAGLLEVEAICRAEGVVRVALGNVDLAAEIGVQPDDDDALRYVRSRLVVASAAARVAPPIDGVTTNFRDPGVAAVDARRSRRWGMAGKLCIHPRQVAGVNEAFMPTEDELDWARGIVERESAGLFALEGEMVDAPVIARARRLLARHRQHQS